MLNSCDSAATAAPNVLMLLASCPAPPVELVDEVPLPPMPPLGIAPVGIDMPALPETDTVGTTVLRVVAPLAVNAVEMLLVRWVVTLNDAEVDIERVEPAAAATTLEEVDDSAEEDLAPLTVVAAAAAEEELLEPWAVVWATLLEVHDVLLPLLLLLLCHELALPLWLFSLFLWLLPVQWLPLLLALPLLLLLLLPLPISFLAAMLRSIVERGVSLCMVWRLASATIDIVTYF